MLLLFIRWRQCFVLHSPGGSSATVAVQLLLFISPPIETEAVLKPCIVISFAEFLRSLLKICAAFSAELSSKYFRLEENDRRIRSMNSNG